MQRKNAVVTGLGAISAYGGGVDIFWQQLVAGKQAFTPITLFPASMYRNNLAGEVPNWKVSQGISRAVSFLKKAVEEAATAAKLEQVNPGKIGLCFGTNFAGAQSRVKALKNLAQNGSKSFCLSQATMGAGLQVIKSSFGYQGPAEIISLSCASGTAALGKALSWIRNGRAEVVLAGGFDELSEHCYAGLSSLRAITRDQIRPFDARRNGTLFAEGAGVVVVESRKHALRRKVEALALMIGWAVNNDAFNLTAPEKEGRGIQRVMRMALNDAGICPTQINHINCHATATRYNDLIETKAIKAVFARHAAKLSLTANKSCFGHAMGAAGALEAIATILSLKHGIVPGTIGLEEPEPELDLDYTAQKSRQLPIKIAMSNSYGLGGSNATIIFKRIDK